MSVGSWSENFSESVVWKLLMTSETIFWFEYKSEWVRQWENNSSPRPVSCGQGDHRWSSPHYSHIRRSTQKKELGLKMASTIQYCLSGLCCWPSRNTGNTSNYNESIAAYFIRREGRFHALDFDRINSAPHIYINLHIIFSQGWCLSPWYDRERYWRNRSAIFRYHS